MRVSSLAYMCYRIVISDLSEFEALNILNMSHLHTQWQKHQIMYKRIEELENPVYRHEATIYGGYVRDLIALEIPRDIDIRFTSSTPSPLDGETLGKKISAFIGSLLKVGFEVYPIGKLGDYSGYLAYRVIVQEDDLSIALDLCGNSGTTPFKDFDVNQLTLSSMKSTTHDIRVLTKRILAKTMCVLDHTPSHHIWRQSKRGKILWKRMQSMKQRGWTIENEHSCDNEQCLLSGVHSIKRTMEVTHISRTFYYPGDDIEIPNFKQLRIMRSRSIRSF
jgi:hypothetical protein